MKEGCSSYEKRHWEADLVREAGKTTGLELRPKGRGADSVTAETGTLC